MDESVSDSSTGMTRASVSSVVADNDQSANSVKALDNVKYDVATNVAVISGELSDTDLANLKDEMLTQSKLSGILPTINMVAAATDAVQPTVTVTPVDATMSNVDSAHNFTINAIYNDANQTLNSGVLDVKLDNGYLLAEPDYSSSSQYVASTKWISTQEFQINLKSGIASGTSISVAVKERPKAIMQKGDATTVTANLTGNDGVYSATATGSTLLNADNSETVISSGIGSTHSNSSLTEPETVVIPTGKRNDAGWGQDKAFYQGIVMSKTGEAYDDASIKFTGSETALTRYLYDKLGLKLNPGDTSVAYAAATTNSTGSNDAIPVDVNYVSASEFDLDFGSISSTMYGGIASYHSGLRPDTEPYTLTQDTQVNGQSVGAVTYTIAPVTDPVFNSKFSDASPSNSNRDVLLNQNVVANFNTILMTNGTQSNMALNFTLPSTFDASYLDLTGYLNVKNVQYSTDGGTTWQTVGNATPVSSQPTAKAPVNDFNEFDLSGIPTGKQVALKVNLNDGIQNVTATRGSAISGKFINADVGSQQTITLDDLTYVENGEAKSMVSTPSNDGTLYQTSSNALTQETFTIADSVPVTVYYNDVSPDVTAQTNMAVGSAKTYTIRQDLGAGTLDNPYIYVLVPKGFSSGEDTDRSFGEVYETINAAAATYPLSYSTHSGSDTQSTYSVQTLADGSKLYLWKVNGQMTANSIQTALQVDSELTEQNLDYGDYQVQFGIGTDTETTYTVPTANPTVKEYKDTELSQELQSAIGTTNANALVRTVTVTIPKQTISTTTIKSASDSDVNADGTSRYTDGLSGVATVQPGGTVTYQVTNTNSGSVPVQNPDVILNLPAVGDKLTTSSATKGSQFDATLSDNTPITVILNGKALDPSTYTLAYTTSTDPTRTASDGSTIGTGVWSTDADDASSVKVTLNGVTYNPGDSLAVSFTADVADSTVPVGEKAYTTVTVSGTNTDASTGTTTPVVLESNKSALTTSDIAVQTTNTVVDQGSAAWKAADNFVSAKDPDGTSVDVSKLTTTGTVDTSKAGVYTVTYNLTANDSLNQSETKSSVATVTVLPIQTVNYVAQGGYKDGQTLGTNTLGGIKQFGSASGNQVGTKWSSVAPTVAGYHLADATQATLAGTYAADNPTKTVYLVADSTNVKVTYTDDTTKAQLAQDSLTGDYGNTVNDDVAGKISDYETKGYKLVSSDYPTGTVTFTDKDQAYNVHLVHVTKTVHPDTPGNDDKTDEKALQRDVSEYVHYVDTDGNTVAPDVTDGVSFTRIATVDEVTGNVTYTDWAAKDGKTSFTEKVSPKVTGYTPDQASIAQVDGLTPDSLNTDETVVYTADPESFMVYHIDQNGNNLSDPVAANGKYGETYDETGQKAVFDHYDLVDSPEALAGTYTTNTKDMVFKYAAQAATVVMNYVVDDSDANQAGNVLHAPETLTGVYNDAYAGEPLEFTGYHLTSSDKTSGTYQADDTTPAGTFYYAPDATKLTVTYDDDTTGDTLKTDTVDGYYNDPVTYDEAGTVKGYEDAGYKLVSSDYPTSAFTFTDGDQAYTIHLAHSYSNYTPDTPGDTDETNHDALVHVVNEDIDYVYENGLIAHGDVTDSVEFDRTATVDNVTKAVTYSDWDALNGKTSFSEKVSPVIDGYEPDQASIAEVDNLTADSTDVRETVVYAADTEALHVDYVNQDGEMIATGDTLTGKTGETYTTHAKSIEGYTLTETPDNANGVYVATDNPDVVYVYAADQQTATVTYVDQTDNKVLTAETLTGDSGSTSDYRTADTIKDYESQGYDLVSDSYPADGVVFDKDDTVGQSFQVVLKHHISDITDTTKLNKAITETVNYVYSDGTTAAPSVTQTVDFTRTGTVDQVTGDETYTDWTVKGIDGYAAVTSPTITGYTPDQVTVDGITSVKDTDADSNVKVTYTEDPVTDTTGTGTGTTTSTTGTDTTTTTGTGTGTDTETSTPKANHTPTTTGTATNTPETETPTVDGGGENTPTDGNTPAVNGNAGNNGGGSATGSQTAGTSDTGSTGSVFTGKAATTPTSTSVATPAKTAAGTTGSSDVTTSRLPQTGETNDADSLAVLGLALMGLSGLAIGGMKRKREE